MPWRPPLGILAGSLLLISCGTAAQSPAPQVATATPLPSAVSASGAPDAQAADLPEGWRREQVREGFVGRHFEDPLVSFTIDLPPGWSAGESWAGRDGPSGWIAAPAIGDQTPTLRFDLGRGFGYSVETLLERDSRRAVTQPLVEGEQAILYLSKPEAIDRGPQIGIFYTRIPGGPAGKDIPSLAIEGDSRGFTDQALLGRVLTSIRYAPIARLPDLPVSSVRPGPDWKRIPARSDYPSFTIMAPPGWRTVELMGIDSLVGRIEGDGITLHYDFGGYGGTPWSPEYRVSEYPTDPDHMIWEEVQGDQVLLLVRPITGDAGARTVTGGYIYLPPVLPGRANVSAASISASGLSGHQQDIVLAMLRTIEFQAR